MGRVCGVGGPQARRRSRRSGRSPPARRPGGGRPAARIPPPDKSTGREFIYPKAGGQPSSDLWASQNASYHCSCSRSRRGVSNE